MSKIVKLLSIFVIGALLVSSCSQDKSKKIEKNLAEKSKEKSKQLKKDFNKAKQVFYSLPSPIETAMLIKRSGVNYDPNLLNPLENQTKYISTYNLAMNLGIYTTDISYASIFSQSQTSIKYMGTAKSLAESLGILDAIDQTTIERLENNINNRDSIMDIISATFMNSDSFLKDNGRPETAALIIAGGWIEGLYLATQHAKVNPENEEIVDRIIDQKISLQSLTQLLKSYKQDEKVSKALNNLIQIEEAFDNFKIVSSDIESVTSEGDNKTILKAKTDVYHDKSHITKLTRIVDSVRTTIVRPK